MAEERRHISQLNLLTPAAGDLLMVQDISEGTGAGADAYKRLPLSAMALLGTAQTWTAAQTFDGAVTVKRISSGILTVSNNTALSVTPPADTGAMLTFYGFGPGMLNNFGGFALWAFRQLPGGTTVALATGANAAVTIGALTGTTGSSGRITYSSDGNNLYVENRTGSTVNLRYILFG